MATAWGGGRRLAGPRDQRAPAPDRRRASRRTRSRPRARPRTPSPDPRSRPGGRRTRPRASRPTRSGSAWSRRAPAARWPRSSRPARAPPRRLARLGQPVDQPELVRALGVDRIAGQRQLHRDVAGQHAREPQQRAAGGDQRALDLGDPERARRARRRSGRTASAISSPPATAKPSIAAISGLSAARWVMPAKPRSPTYGRSPATNAFRSMPAQKPLPAPVSTPTRQPGVGVELVERRGDPCGDGGVDRVALVGAVERDQRGRRSRRSVRTASWSLMPRTVSGPARARLAAPPGRPRRSRFRAPRRARAPAA